MQKLVFSDDIGANSRRNWPLAIPIIVLLIFTLGQALALVPGRFVFGFTRESLFTYPTILYFIAGSFAMAGVVQMLWVRYFERRTLASIGLQAFSGASTPYVAGFGYGLAMAGAAVFSIYLLGAYEVEANISLSTSDIIPIFLLMLAFMIQSGTEEFIFRGWMMSRLIERYGVWVGVIGNSVLFTIMHLPSIEDEGVAIALIFAANVFLFSIFLSLYALKERSVWGIAAWHAAWNWSYITWFGLPTTGIALDLKPLITDLAIVEETPIWLSGGIVGPENSIAVTLILGIGCLIMLAKRRRTNTNEPK